jgi:glycosyltransferase involved in cell wall biosynthesis
VIRNKLYYGIKPLIPAFVRHRIRRWFALKKRSQVADIWPILPGSERPPEGWPGWPHGKKFAFVLTHDVEGPEGVAKCRQLMELEMKWGFRSSFNFIPEGDYRVSRELREELTRNGFEVGVHDLHHDGKLFRSREGFGENAAQINRYLKEWGAVGFRSGFMLHRPDWMTDLEILYDASTFDTDPFEPQPDGVGTIFPFWKEGANGRRYVELPYTLAQDSTLFILFAERTAETWLKKLDWIAGHGGMALVNIHPDYMRFEGEATSDRTFPSQFYSHLLQHVREKYGQSVWHALPKEVAAWFAKINAPKLGETSALQIASSSACNPKRSLGPGRVAVVLYSYYLSDPRPRRETEALVEAGMEADVICLRRDISEPAFEMVNGVNIHRVALQRRRGRAGGYIMRYAFFFLCAFWRLAVWSLSRKYKLVHVHNMPDFLVFTAAVPRLRGAKVILDLHDPMPELYCGIYSVEKKKKSFAYWMLCRLERWSIAFADKVLTPNIAFKDIFVARNNVFDKVEIVMNSPRPTIFGAEKYEAKAREPGETFILMYHGLLAERHGLDLAIDALSRLNGEFPGIKLEIYGDRTDYGDQILCQVDLLKMQERVRFHGYKTQAEIAKAIVSIDLGLIPNRLNAFTNINFPTRIFEYLAMNKPVMVPRTKGVADYFGEDEILYFEPGNIDDLARKIVWACTHPFELHAMMEKGRQVYRKNSWIVQETRLLDVVGSLVSPHPTEQLIIL